MSKEKQFQKVKFQMSNFKLEGLSAEEIDRYMQATTSLVTCYHASMQEQFFLETIGEKVRGQLTKQAATLPIRGKFQVAMKNGILVLEWEKFSMNKFHEYLLIVKDFSTAKKSGDVDLHQQAKRYVHNAIQKVLDLNIAQIGNANDFSLFLATVIDDPCLLYTSDAADE